MSDKHPFFSIIATSAVFSLAVFGALQYVQVLPLEREVAKQKEQLSIKEKSIKTSSDYQNLNNLHIYEKARAELLQKELNSKVEVEDNLTRINQKLTNANNQISGELVNTKKLTAQYISALENQSLTIELLKQQVSLKMAMSPLSVENHQVLNSATSRE